MSQAPPAPQQLSSGHHNPILALPPSAVTMRGGSPEEGALPDTLQVHCHPGGRPAALGFSKWVSAGTSRARQLGHLESRARGTSRKGRDRAGCKGLGSIPVQRQRHRDRDRVSDREDLGLWPEGSWREEGREAVVGLVRDEGGVGNRTRWLGQGWEGAGGAGRTSISACSRHACLPHLPRPSGSKDDFTHLLIKHFRMLFEHQTHRAGVHDKGGFLPFPLRAQSCE